ncbi:hypothetical protein MASR1M32_27210 [Rhodobacter sp.]
MKQLLKIADWTIPAPETDVFDAADGLRDALVAYWYGGDPPRRSFSGAEFVGRAQGCDLSSIRISKQLTCVELALELAGPLLGNILNCSFTQFVFNCPFVLDETALMLKSFAPRQAFEGYWKMVGPLASRMEEPRQRLLASGGDVGDAFWHDVNHLIDEYFHNRVSVDFEDEWTTSYIGNTEIQGKCFSFGLPTAAEPWSITVARGIVDLAISKPFDLGVDLTFEEVPADTPPPTPSNRS